MIVTVTLNPVLDRTLTVPQIIFNDVLHSLYVYENYAGKGINVSRALKLLGIETIATGYLGGDTGQKIENGLTKIGITCDFVHGNEDTRTNTVILEQNSDRHIKVNEPGPILNKSKQEEIITKITDKVQAGDWWVFSGSLPPGAPVDFYSHLIRLVQRKGARSILDTSGMPLRSGCEAKPFLVKPNKVEAEEISGVTIRQNKDAQKAAHFFLAYGIQFVALSLGADGLLLASPDKSILIEPPTVPIRNPTGAGDALLSGIIWALQQNRILEEVARYGVAAGTVSAMKEEVAFGTLDEIEKIYAMIK